MMWEVPNSHWVLVVTTAEGLSLLEEAFVQQWDWMIITIDYSLVAPPLHLPIFYPNVAWEKMLLSNTAACCTLDYPDVLSVVMCCHCYYLMCFFLFNLVFNSINLFRSISELFFMILCDGSNNSRASWYATRLPITVYF